ncbi:MAG TPA: class I SAM-dependent methyltransferase [Gemmatimonadaceae bacterium]|nr:class I SAM-dependent methyltransferase [Gemmatimonadaceae bacterium]
MTEFNSDRDPYEGSTATRRETVTELYDNYFSTRFGFDARRDLVWREVVKWLQNRYIPADSRVLDLGAGYCNFINNVTAREKHAVDVFTRFPSFAAPDVNTHVSSVTSMDFFDDSHFDVAFASNLFEHLNRPDLLMLLREMRRILKPGGLLILMQPNFKYCSETYFDDYTHIQIFTDASLYDFLEAYGFAIRDAFPKFMPVNMKSTLRLNLPMLPLIVRTYLSMPFKPFAGQMLMVARNTKTNDE